MERYQISHDGWCCYFFQIGHYVTTCGMMLPDDFILPSSIKLSDDLVQLPYILPPKFMCMQCVIDPLRLNIPINFAINVRQLACYIYIQFFKKPKGLTHPHPRNYLPPLVVITGISILAKMCIPYKNKKKQNILERFDHSEKLRGKPGKLQNEKIKKRVPNSESPREKLR